MLSWLALPVGGPAKLRTTASQTQVSATMDERHSFGVLLRQYRTAVGLTQEELAEQAGLSARAITDLERGVRRFPYPDTIARLSAALRLGDGEQAALRACRRRLAPALAARVPPDHAKHNLPAQLTTFIGREQEIAELVNLVATRRLLTLVGAGGIGKTRLALKVAAAAAQLFGDGVWLVDLAAITDASLVPHAAARALDVPQAPHQHQPLDLLAEALHDRELLLVLDNCEHLVEACAQLAHRLLQACPGLRVLATSREALQIDGETIWRVPPLAYPDPRHPPPLSQLKRFQSIALFVERATSARPDFRLTERNAAAVLELSARLDGMPLALELAAARLRSLTVEQLAQRLDDRFRLLTSGSRTALPRHQMLRATLEWSHALLSGPEQVLFRRLAVFAGGWTLEASETVCVDAALSVSSVLDALDGLVNKSLVLADEQAGAQRYRTLETIRHYAVERLEEAGEVAQFRHRHRTWVTGLVEMTPPEAYDAAALAALDHEQDNLRAALRSALDAGDADGALRLSSNWLFWYMRGHYTEGRAWITRALALPAAEPRSVLRGRAMCSLGYLAYLQGDLNVAESMLQDSRRMGFQLADDNIRAVALHQLGNVAKVRGDLGRAVALVAEALGLTRQLGNRNWEAMHLVVLTELKLETGAHKEAQDLAQQCLVLARELGHTWSLARSLHYLGRLAVKAGDMQAGAALLAESLTVQRGLGNRQGLSSTLAALGQHALSTGDRAVAGRHLGEAIRVSHDINELVNVAVCLSGIAALAAHADPTLSVQLASAAMGQWAALAAQPYPENREDLNRLLTNLHERVDDTTFAEAERVGRSLSLDRVIALALSVADGCAAGEVPGTEHA